MPQVEKSMVVPYTQEQMFLLVNDVRSYPEFLPYCTQTSVISEDFYHLEASLTFAKAGLKKSFTTRNELERSEKMTVHLVDGPFKSLEGHWQFIVYREVYTKVRLDMRYEFSSSSLAWAFGPLFNQVAQSLVDSFYQRAKEVYG